MVMDTLQIRLTPFLTKKVDELVNQGLYSSRSDAIREAIRNLVWEKEIGSILAKGNSTKLIKDARKQLSKQHINLNEINKL